MGKMMTVREVAEMFRISVLTLYGWTSSRKIPHVKLGGKVLFDEAELKAWCDARRVQSPRHPGVHGA